MASRRVVACPLPLVVFATATSSVAIALAQTRLTVDCRKCQCNSSSAKCSHIFIDRYRVRCSSHPRRAHSIPFHPFAFPSPSPDPFQPLLCLCVCVCIACARLSPPLPLCLLCLLCSSLRLCLLRLAFTSYAYACVWCVVCVRTPSLRIATSFASHRLLPRPSACPAPRVPRVASVRFSFSAQQQSVLLRCPFSARNAHTSVTSLADGAPAAAPAVQARCIALHPPCPFF